MTSSVSANATTLPANILAFPRRTQERPRKVKYRQLDPGLVTMLSGDSWNNVGITCRLALAGFRVEGDDLVHAIGELIDGDVSGFESVREQRALHRKVLQRALLLLRDADRRENVALDKALSARGF